jgi:hypothetical protein
LWTQVRAGATLLFDSDPDAEEEETQLKVTSPPSSCCTEEYCIMLRLIEKIVCVALDEKIKRCHEKKMFAFSIRDHIVEKTPSSDRMRSR